ncbi:glycosyl transferase family protein [Nostoc sp. NIES-2111]
MTAEAAIRRDPAELAGEHDFACFVRTLARGPGRARALTREEARRAFGMVLAGEADPHQIGAFLMLLRFRGEEATELAGMVEAARETIGAVPPRGMAVDLDWPSYGAGRTRNAPWFLLAALALARAGHRIVMHGSNEFSSGTSVADALGQLGLRPATGRADAERLLDREGFAYLPLAALSSPLEGLLQLRAVLGLRSPVNTLVRLLDPFDAHASIDGVFHPPYIALHLNAARLLDRRRLLVLKGGGGEAERNPAKAVTAHLYDAGTGPGEIEFPPLAPGMEFAGDLQRVWLGEDEAPVPIVIATIALGLIALGRAGTPADADRIAADLWRRCRSG